MESEAMELLFLLVLAPSFFGIPGALAGWIADRRGNRGIAIVAAAFILVVAAVVVGFSASESAFDAFAAVAALAIVGLNACTAFAGAALSRHARNRDSHLT
jgi:MFS family permease